MKNRCFGNKPNQTLYAQYHDEEWGVPSHDDRHLFEMLILEGAQAGVDAVGQDAEGDAGPDENLGAVRTAQVLPGL